MSEEEKNIVEILKADKKMLEENYTFGKQAKLEMANDIEKGLNLIEKQDKMIDLMAEYMKENLYDGEKMYICNGFTYEIKTCACMNENESCKEKIKEQFRKKVKND